MDEKYIKASVEAMEREVLDFCEQLRKMADAIPFENDSNKKVYMTKMEDSLKEAAENLIPLCKFPISIVERKKARDAEELAALNELK